MKELPYFRFTPSEWQNGKISLEDFELQGYFINVCSYYWISDCSITRIMLEKKFRNTKNLLELCLELEIFQHDLETDFISFSFLNVKFDERCNLRKQKQLAGSKGGIQKKINCSSATTLLQQNDSKSVANKNKNKNKKENNNKNRKEEEKENIEIEIAALQPPTKKKLDELILDFKESLYNFCEEKGGSYSAELVKEFFNYWSEPNQSKTKMRWQLEKTFAIPNRLATWRKNEQKFNQNGNSQNKTGVGLGNKANGTYSSPNNAEKRRNEREGLTELSLAILADVESRKV